MIAIAATAFPADDASVAPPFLAMSEFWNAR